MGVLEKIRNRAGLMVGFVGVALAAFVLGDALQNGNTWFSDSQRAVLTVDGETINIEDYERRLQSLTEQMQAQAGGQLTDEQRMSINNSLTQQIIAEHLLQKLAKQVGVQVTADEVYALLNAGSGITPSPQAQQFFAGLGIDMADTKAVNDFIKQLSDSSIESLPKEQQSSMRMIQAQWKNLQHSLLTSRLQQKIQTILSRSYKVTDLDKELGSATNSRTVALVRTTPMQGTDPSADAKDEDIKKYYDTHPNFFLSQEPSSEVSYISVQVTPSSDDYKASEAAAQKAFTELEAATTETVSDVVRNHSGNFQDIYLTASELEQMGLGANEAEFVKTTAVGTAKNFGLVGNKYNLIKLVNKKSSAESMGLQVIVLDSVMSKKSDAVLAEYKAGTSFDSLVTKYSQDAETKANGGRLSQQGQFGIPMDSFTEAQLAGSPFAEAYKKPVGEAFVVDNGAIKLVVRSTDAKPAVEKYQIAAIAVDATFSEKTYNSKYDALNRILGAGGEFADMVKKAEKEGFTVVKSEVVSTSVPQLAQVPGSRQLVSFALRAEEGEVTDKVHRIGTDYLVIAKAVKHFKPGVMPLSLVREQIAARLSAEKRAANLAANLTKKGLTSLDAYASELGVAVDTLQNVSYLVRGSEAAAFNGKAMTTALGQLSKPFVAGTEVMVVQPISKDAADAETLKAMAQQAEQGTAYQIAGRVFQNLLQKTKIEDNRARFY